MKKIDEILTKFEDVRELCKEIETIQADNKALREELCHCRSTSHYVDVIVGSAAERMTILREGFVQHVLEDICAELTKQGYKLTHAEDHIKVELEEKPVPSYSKHDHTNYVCDYFQREEDAFGEYSAIKVGFEVQSPRGAVVDKVEHIENKPSDYSAIRVNNTENSPCPNKSTVKIYCLKSGLQLIRTKGRWSSKL